MRGSPQRSGRKQPSEAPASFRQDIGFSPQGDEHAFPYLLSYAQVGARNKNTRMGDLGGRVVVKLGCSQRRAEILLHSPNKYLLSLAVCINMEM